MCHVDPIWQMGRVQLIVTSSKHNQLGPKLPVLNTCENKLEMLEVLRCSEIALTLFNTENARPKFSSIVKLLTLEKHSIC